MAIQASLKAIAVSAIFFAWANVTIEAFKLSWHIISTSPVTKVVCGKCQEHYDGVHLCTKVVCGNCQEPYYDDEYHLINGAHLCEACR